MSAFRHPDIIAALERQLAEWDAEMAESRTDILVR
jgi:hypothetical protein